MINLPATLTPVPKCPGYFWDTAKDKLFSIKTAGELRELKLSRVHPAMMRYKIWGSWSVGDAFYRVSVQGRNRYLLRTDLRNLPHVDYDIPVVERV